MTGGVFGWPRSSIDCNVCHDDHRAIGFYTTATAMAKISLNEVRTRASTVDRAKLNVSTEEDIRRHTAEDGYADLKPPTSVRVVYPPKDIRTRSS